MQNRIRRKKYVPAWQIEYTNAYKKYLKIFTSLELKNYEPVSLGEFVHFKSWQDLMKEEQVGTNSRSR